MRSIAELMRLDGRVALITGGAGHVGRAIAGALAEVGASIALLDAVDPQDVAAELRAAHGVESCALRVDLAEETQVREAPAFVAEKLGGVDILVNCAAYVGSAALSGWACQFAGQSADTWRKAIEINLTSAFVLVQSARTYLAGSGHGSIINIGSIYGVSGQDLSLYEGTDYLTPAAYAASKGGLLQLTRYLATVLAPQVRVNAISPGGIWRNHSEEFRRRYEARTPLARMGREEDLKGAAVYLASDMSAYVTGQNLLVDGGWTT